MSDEDFALEHLGISPRTLYDWQRRPDTVLRPGTQKVLQEFYESTSDDVRLRFQTLTDDVSPTGPTLVGPAEPEPSGVMTADLGLIYPGQPGAAAIALTELLRADHDDVQGLSAAIADPSASQSAALSWLVNDASPIPTGRSDKPRIGASDIARLRATTEVFDKLDGQYGGGHARSSLVEYLNRDLGTLLNGSYPERTGRELYRAAAQATLLCAWMSYDAGAHALAQRYFIQALGLADASGDRLIAASILDAMSHQSTFLGRYREAANLARAAGTGTAALGSRSLAAHFLVMEARALARIGDAAACDRAMSAAVREFEGRDVERDPEWFQYFDEAELAAELGHCNRDLGRPVDATTYAAQSIGAKSESARSDFFVTMVLADAHLDRGDVDEACDVALRALELGEQLKSARCAAYVDEFRTRLSRVGDIPAVRDFTERARETRLWTPNG